MTRSHPPGRHRRRTSPVARRALLAVAAGLAVALVPAPAAWAHGAHAPAATNYRTEITGVAPPLAGVTVRVIEAGTGLELTNRAPEPVQVLGYDGEPYLQVRPDGAYENIHSPATYLNQDPSGALAVPGHADPAAEPAWRRVSDDPVVRWYDRRTVGADDSPAAGAGGDRVREWELSLTRGDTRSVVTGTREWLPPPSPWPWWAGAALAAAALGALGRYGHTRPARAGLAAASVAGGVAALLYAAARELDAGATSPAEVASWLLTGRPWTTLSAVAAVAAGGWLLAGVVRRHRPDEAPVFALAVAAACLVLFAGLADAAVLARSVAPVPFDLFWARSAVTAVLAAGGGGMLAATLTLRRSRVAGAVDRS